MKSVPLQDWDLWSVWDQIRCPVLVLRGADSDVLLPDIAAQMRRRGPRAEVVEFAGVGHAPALMAPEQIEVIRRWLLAEPERLGRTRACSAANGTIAPARRPGEGAWDTTASAFRRRPSRSFFKRQANRATDVAASATQPAGGLAT